jgi:GTP cyclohydrolase II
MPTKWGMFEAVAFERDVSNGSPRAETALALVMGDVTDGVPLLRMHSQCFTREVREHQGTRTRFAAARRFFG